MRQIEDWLFLSSRNPLMHTFKAGGFGIYSSLSFDALPLSCYASRLFTHLAILCLFWLFPTMSLSASRATADQRENSCEASLYSDWNKAKSCEAILYVLGVFVLQKDDPGIHVWFSRVKCWNRARRDGMMQMVSCIHGQHVRFRMHCHAKQIWMHLMSSRARFMSEYKMVPALWRFFNTTQCKIELNAYDEEMKYDEEMMHLTRR